MGNEDRTGRADGERSAAVETAAARVDPSPGGIHVEPGTCLWNEPLLTDEELAYAPRQADRVQQINAGLRILRSRDLSQPVGGYVWIHTDAPTGYAAC